MSSRVPPSFEPMPLPTPLVRPVPMYVDRSLAMSVDNSVLIGNGPVIGRVTFTFDDEQKAGIVCADLERLRIWMECPGLGVAMIDINNITHQFIHMLCDSLEPCDAETQP